MNISFPPFSGLVIAGALSAQTLQTFVMPASAVGVDLPSSTAYPFDTGACRVLHIVSRNHFSGAGVSYPVMIRRLRVRADGAAATWAGATISQFQLDLSTSPVSYGSISATFNSNHGADRQTMYQGSLAIPGMVSGGGVGPFHVDIPFNGQFRYDPAQGDLTVDFGSSGVPTLANTPALDYTTVAGVARSRRVISTNPLATTGTVTTGESCLAIEVTYVRDQLVADFSVTPTLGTCSSTSFHFTDLSTTSDLGGITSWAWDFDNDGTTDSTAQNPSHYYSTPGTYSVRLTVADTVHGSRSVLRNNLITVSRNTPALATGLFSYTASTTNPGQVQFTTGTYSSYAWDFDDDGITDSTLQNPLATVPMGCSQRVRLTVVGSCRDYYAVQDICVPRFLQWGAGTSALDSQTTEAFSYLDLDVLPDAGVTLCAIDAGPSALPCSCPIFTQYVPCGYLPSLGLSVASMPASSPDWRDMAIAQGPYGQFFIQPPSVSLHRLDQPLFLPRGRYSLRFRWERVAEPCTIPLRLTDSAQVPSDTAIHVLGARTQQFAAGGWQLPTNQTFLTGLHYVVQHVDNDIASYGYLGNGCPGSLGVPGLRATGGSLPRLGQTLTVAVDRLPMSACFLITGLSNVVSTIFGPLPAAIPQLPGCSLRVRDDVIEFLLGANNAVAWSLQVPASTAMLGLSLFQQALVLSPGTNNIGGVLSDATGCVIGR